MSTATVTESVRKQRRRFDAHVARLAVLLAVIIAALSILKPDRVAYTGTWTSMAIQFPEFGIMALGVMLTMITGGIDLSVVGIANMSAITAATVMLTIAPRGSTAGVESGAIAAAVVVALLLGLAAGILNGILVAIVQIPPILATLGSQALFTGVAIVVSGGKPKSGLPPLYSQVFASNVAGVVPVQLLVYVIAAVVIWVLLRKTTFGAKLFMLGTNPTAARFSGLNSRGLLIATYAVSGVLASLAGLVMLANYNSAKADYGTTYVLLTVLIVVLGGVNPNGGSGRLAGVVLATLILQVLSSGLNMFPQVSNFYRMLIWGAVLLVVVSTTDLSWRRLLSRSTRKKVADDTPD